MTASSSQSARPSLAVIVPATDAPPTLGRCLDALRIAAPQIEPIVLRRPAYGPAAARNAGAALADADVLVFVDADVLVHPDALDRIGDRFAVDRGLAAVFGSYDDEPEAPGAVSRFRNLLHHSVHTRAPGPAETFWAGLGAVRAEAFAAAGGFDAARFPLASIEDIELGRRLRACGGRIVLDPAVRGTHLKRWSLGSMVRTDFARRGLPWARLQLEEREPAGSLNLAPRRRLAALASAAALAAALAARPRLALASLASLVALDAPLYRVLARRGGLRLAAAGVPLHVLHHLTAIGAAGAAAGAHAAAGFPRIERPASPLRVGLVGCGRIAELGYVPAIGGLEAIEIAAVADPDAARRGRLAALASPAMEAGPAAYASAAEMLAATELDAVVVTSPASGHVADTALVAEAGLPCLVEKPPAPNLEGAKWLATLDPAPWIGFNRRFQHAAPLLARVPLGRMDIELELRYRRSSWGAHTVRDDAILDLAPHLVDLALLLSSSDSVRVVSASIEAERVQLELETERGRAAIRCASDQPYFERVALRDGAGRVLAASGAGGMRRAVLTRLPGVAHPLVDSLRSQLSAFERAVRGGEPGLLATAADGARAMAVIEAARVPGPAATWPAGEAPAPVAS
jgi:predicted dehydrogenase